MAIKFKGPVLDDKTVQLLAPLTKPPYTVFDVPDWIFVSQPPFDFSVEGLSPELPSAEEMINRYLGAYPSALPVEQLRIVDIVQRQREDTLEAAIAACNEEKE